MEKYNLIMEIIKGRRSIRKYKNDNIPNELIEKVIDAARLAPSWANTQCWHFIIVKDSLIKSELAMLAGERNPAYNALKDAPVVIVACAKQNIAGFYKGKQATVKGDWSMFDVALAMDHLTLAAYSLGLGTVHVGLFNHEKAVQLLNLPSDLEVIEMMPLGYPDESPSMRQRKNINEIVSYDKFNDK